MSDYGITVIKHLYPKPTTGPQSAKPPRRLASPTRTVANEFGQFGIRANIIAPGLTITPMTDAVMVPGMAEAFIRETPLGRLNSVEDVAAATLFAVSDECFMSGQTFHVTGGITLRKLPSATEIAASIQAASR